MTLLALKPILSHRKKIVGKQHCDKNTRRADFREDSYDYKGNCQTQHWLHRHGPHGKPYSPAAACSWALTHRLRSDHGENTTSSVAWRTCRCNATDRSRAKRRHYVE